MKEFSKEVLKEFCKSNSRFRKCYPHVKKASCRKAARYAYKKCKNRATRKYPKQITLPQTQKIGEQVGVCMGPIYHKKLGRNPAKTIACLKR